MYHLTVIHTELLNVSNLLEICSNLSLFIPVSSFETIHKHLLCLLREATFKKKMVFYKKVLQNLCIYHSKS